MAIKPYVRTKPKHVIAPNLEAVTKTCFINDLLDGTVKATTATTVKSNGQFVRVDYNDPTP
jgi:hypothetical protein